MRLRERKLYEFVHPARIAPKRTNRRAACVVAAFFPERHYAAPILGRVVSLTGEHLYARDTLQETERVSERENERSNGRNDFNAVRKVPPDRVNVAVSDRDARPYFYGAICADGIYNSGERERERESDTRRT